jgi:hypothetical protein
MENRHRDKVSQSTEPTDAGDINREVASRRGKEEHISDAEFGQNIGEAENLEPKTGDRGNSSGRSEGNH